MGKVMQKLEKPEPPKAAPVPAAPAVPADGLTAETLFAPECASIVAELADGVSLDGFQFTELGVTADDGQFAIDGETLPHRRLDGYA